MNSENTLSTEYQKLTLSISSMLKFGWYLVKENLRMLLLITLITSIPSNIIAYILIEGHILPIRDGLSWIKDVWNVYKLSSFIFWSIGALAGLFVLKNFLRGIQKPDPKNALLYGIRKWGIFIGTSILYFFSIIAGTLLLIIPGIIVSVWFMFYTYSIVFAEKSFIDALKYSKSLVIGRWWQVFWKSMGFGILWWLIFSLPIILLGFGIGFLTADYQSNVVVSVTTDVFLDLLSVPSAYIGVGLFLAFQKTRFEEWTHTQELQTP